LYAFADEQVRLNLNYPDLLQKIVIPYINKQVTPMSFGTGMALLNLSAVSYIRIFKTQDALPEGINPYDNCLVLRRHPSVDCTQEILDEFLFMKSPTESIMESISLLQTLFKQPKPQVFVIMKFKDTLLDSAYKEVIRPIIKKFGYKPLRIDEVQDSGRISDQILTEIIESEIILADLSEERPNCYYEAGFAHAIRKKIIFTIRKGSNIHFDLAGHRFIEWETEGELRRELQKRFKAIKGNGIKSKE
jgi:hypothetical protein